MKEKDWSWLLVCNNFRRREEERKKSIAREWICGDCVIFLGDFDGEIYFGFSLFFFKNVNFPLKKIYEYIYIYIIY